jgi:hypothetical protein
MGDRSAMAPLQPSLLTNVRKAPLAPRGPITRAIIAIAPLCCGCAAAGLYTTPETLPPRKVQAVGMFEAWRIERTVPPQPGGIFGGRREQTEGVTLVPSAMVRVGVIDGIEVGAGLARVDVKVRLFHVGILSAAIDPIGRIVVTQDGYGEVAELPVLVGVRVTDFAVVVVNAGLSYLSLPFDDPNADSNPDEASLAMRSGLGIRIRLGSSLVALQPEVSYLRSLSSRSLDWLTGGIAVDVGGLP